MLVFQIKRSFLRSIMINSYIRSSMNEQNPLSSNIFNIIKNRRSIRRFTEKTISDNDLENILEMGFRAPFAAQLCSIVYTRDPEKMQSLRKIGVYPTTSVLMIFFIDVRRLEKIMKKREREYKYDDGMTLWLGIQDVSLVAENIVLAAEALGMGSVLLGVAPLQADLIADVLNVPKRVFPVVGLCLGYPDPQEETDVRPRFPLNLSASEDSYHDLSELDLQECMKAMDDGYLAQGYYIKLQAKIPLKDGKDEFDYDRYSWTEHISRKFCQGRWSDHTMLSLLRNHGFNL